jgi:hypothetical protein
VTAGAVVGPGEGRQFATPFGNVAAIKVEVGVGDFAITVFVARGTAHGFTNRAAEPARMLVIATPGAVELVESPGRLESAGGAPPDPADLRELFAAHRSRLVAEDGRPS